MTVRLPSIDSSSHSVRVVERKRSKIGLPQGSSPPRRGLLVELGAGNIGCGGDAL